MQPKIPKIRLATALLALSSTGALAQGSNDFQGEARDAWIDGKVEMAFILNEHLNPFAIDTKVQSGQVTLSGTVASDIDRDLAGEIAMGVDGVVEVENRLQTGPAEPSDAAGDNEDRDFPTWFDDATTTAAVKSRLVANPNTKGLQIDVDTNEDVVTLSGSVESDEQKQLAAQIAGNTGDVREVRNLLVVDDS